MNMNANEFEQILFWKKDDTNSCENALVFSMSCKIHMYRDSYLEDKDIERVIKWITIQL